MKRNFSSSRQLNYSSLERRLLLAGNVTLFQNPDTGTVFLRGDSEGNDVQIETVENGNVIVQGVDGTTINGQSEFLVDVDDGILPQIGLNLGPGDDTLFVQGVRFERQAIFYGGSGDDTFGFDDVDADADLVVQTFTGDDNISIDSSEINGRLVAFPLEGSNLLAIDNTGVDNNTLIRTGSQSDTIVINDSELDFESYIFTGGGNDTIAINNTEASAFTAIRTESGNDLLELSGVEFGSFAFLDGGAGDNDSLATDNLARESTSDRVTTILFENIDEAIGSTTIDDAFAELTDLGAKI